MPKLTLALIGTFYGRHENTLPLLQRVLIASSRPPDRVYVLCEDLHDTQVALDALQVLKKNKGRRVHVETLPTPRLHGRYAVIPYSNKINWALDHTSCDTVAYLDNGSMPSPGKYELMLHALERNPGWGAVYCAQQRTGYQTLLADADKIVEDAYCAVNYTQVMHRRTADRWPLDMRHADPDLADAIFWRDLHRSLGAFYPVAEGVVLDEHHIPSPAAEGVV